MVSVDRGALNVKIIRCATENGLKEVETRLKGGK